MPENLPRLRPLDPIALPTSEGPRICLRDPLALSDNLISLGPHEFFLCQLLDGTRTLIDLQAEYMRRFGELIFRERIENLIEILDQNYVLDNPRSQTFREELELKLQGETVRPPALAGRSYPPEKEQLKSQLESYFQSVGPVSGSGETIRGLIAPHIDIGIGWEVYALTYREIARIQHVSTIVILGTAHSESRAPVTFSRRDFATPLGITVNDKNSLDFLARKLGPEFVIDELAHRKEHSIEFQVLFLQYLFPERELKIVPVLCDSFSPFVQAGCLPESDPRISKFIAALQKLVSGQPDHFLLLAGADLAHIGLKFGDQSPADADFVRMVESEDREILQRIENIDPEGFYREIAGRQDARRICGLPPIYYLLKTVPASRGKTTKYSQWIEAPTQSAVTFAGTVFS